MLQKTCMVIWSFSRNTPVLNITYPAWLDVSKKLGLHCYIATDDIDCKLGNAVYFTRSGWKNEWLQVCAKLRDLGYANIISVLDDFYLYKGSIDKSVLYSILENDYDYVSFIPHHNTKCLVKYSSVELDKGFCKINKSWRYRNSLQVSFWKLSVFESIIKDSNTIWEFEEIPTNFDKFYCVRDGNIHYRHILEKGMLNYNAIIYSWKYFFRLKKYYKYNFVQLFRMPRILVSNLIMKVFGFRKSEEK